MSSVDVTPSSDESDTVSKVKNDRKLLSELIALIGRPVLVRPGETIDWIRMDEKSAAISVRILHIEETHNEVRITGSGNRLLFWMPCADSEAGADAPWECQIAQEVWDEDFKPIVHRKYDRVRNADEERIKREWDKMCYRPGTSKTPLDSYDRVLSGNYFESEKKMEWYW